MKDRDSTLLPPLGERAVSVYRSLVDQLRTFVHDAGFSDVALGLSGGIDSALAATIAVDALGAAHVHGVAMPSRFTSQASIEDARALAENLGIAIRTIPIDTLLVAYTESLAPALGADRRPVVEQNLQARIRANLLMALSNQFDWLVLATGNLSETMVGYTTLYGDMVGAFAPLAPLYKGWVYELARWRNTTAAIEVDTPETASSRAGVSSPIPASILTKAPSAELAEGQTDEAELGLYATLDGILFYRARGETDEELGDRGFDGADCERISQLIARAAFKRRYAAPGPVLDLSDLASPRSSDDPSA